MITQNRLMLAGRYNADTVSFKVDVASFSNTFEYDNELKITNFVADGLITVEQGLELKKTIRSKII